jgi:amino acid adenylation domain-containing protein
MTPTTVPGAQRAIHRVFESRAASNPDHVAVTFGSSQLTYGELNDRANQVAHHLVSLGVGPEVLVGLCLERGLDLVIALLGILKAGGAYVPIDPQYPSERIRFMLEDSRAPVLVTQQSLAGAVAGHAAHVVLLDNLKTIPRDRLCNLPYDAQANNLAYVIYTSGSTGQPKGTLIEHAQVLRLFEATQPWFEFSERDVWTLFHSCAFDFSVWEIWGALFHGGRLVVVPFDVSRTPERFHRLLREEHVTVLNQTPSAFKQLIHVDETATDRSELDLRLVIFGGEALDFRSLAPWFARHGDQRPRLVNMYGITETTVHVTYRPLSAQDSPESSLIGVPIPDLQIHLRDESGLPVPAGTPGEIYVGGLGVGRGYLNRPAQNAQRFVPDDSTPDPRRRLYRSGDLARQLPNGDLEYLGRIDQQVKLRGFRIELGEITAAINRDAAVLESAVIIGDVRPGEPALHAYVVKRPGRDLDVPALRSALREHLPEYMIPASFTCIERLPITVNGKLDVKALQGLLGSRQSAEPAAPRSSGSALEESIARIWCQALNSPSVGLDQNFFDVGGNSINLVEVHAGLQSLLGREFSITDLFSHATVRSLATHFALPQTADRATTAAARAERQRAALAAQRGLHRKGPA